MDNRIRVSGVTRLLWSLALGLVLVAGLLVVITSRSAVEAQAASLGFRPDHIRSPEQRQSVEAARAASPGPAVDPAHNASWGQTPPGEVASLRAGASGPSTFAPAPVPPQPERRAPDFVPPHTWGASHEFVPLHAQQVPPGGPRTTRGAPLLASVGEAAGVRPREAALLTPPMPGSADLAVCMTTDRVWGVVGAWETVTVTVNGTQMGAALADGKGFFWTTLYDGSGNRPGLAAGDVVRIYHDGVQAASVTLRSITGQVDVVNDVVSGTIGGVSSPISVTIYAPWGEPSMSAYSQTVSTDGSGTFTADFSAVWDLRTWDEATVAYVQGGVEVHRHVYPAASLLVRPAPWNDVMGYAAPGTSVAATVYLSDAVTVKASDTLAAGATDGWYRWDVPTDVVESDVVVVQPAGGTTMSRTVDTLSMNVDAANDRVTGEGEPGATVRGVADLLTPLGWREVQASTTADPSTGVYTLEFGSITNILPCYWVGVLVTDAEGDDLNLWERTPSVEVHQTWNEVYGCSPSPVGPESEGRAVTLTLYSAAADATYVYAKQMDWWSWYYFSEGEDGLPDIAPGDVVTVEAEGYAWQGVVHVMPMTLQHDAEADRFTGTVVTPTSRVELWGSYWQGGLYPAGGQFDVLVTATSPFTAIPPGFDVRGDLQYEVTHRTAGDYAERLYRSTDGFGTVVSSNGFDGALNPPGVPYTITLYDGEGNVKFQLTDVSQEPAGILGYRDFWNTGEQVLPGDYLQVQSAAGFSHTAHIPAMTLEAHPDTDVISGQGPANALLYIRYGDQDQGYVPSDGDGQFAVAVDQLQDVWGDEDLAWGDYVDVTYYDENNTWIVYRFPWPRMRVNYGGDWVGGDYAAGHTVWITVTDGGGTLKATAAVSSTYGRGWGNDGFETRWEDWSPQQPDIAAGDWVYIRIDDGYNSTIRVGTIAGDLDVDENTVSGTIAAAWFTQTLGVRCDVWVGGGPGMDTTAEPDGGSYVCDFDDAGWDLLPGQDVAVHYVEPDGDQVINVFRVPVISVNYGHDWVETEYEAGHTVWITLTDGGGTVKATAVLSTGAVPWWGGGTGFSTNWQGWWPPQPDVAPGDWVYIRIDDGYNSTIRVGTIAGDLDVDENTVAGTITAGWFTQTLHASCQVWVQNGPGMDTTVEPNGGSYSCDFDDVGWDLQPGQDVAVMYYEPDDNDQIINVFREPAPDVRVEKWVEGGGETSPDGTVVYGVRHYNNGDAEATGVVLTDTLPTSTTYNSDGSGFTAYPSGDIVTWSLGTLAPRSQRYFHLVLDVDGGAVISDDVASNIIAIAAGNYEPADWQGDNWSESGGIHIGDGSPDLYVNKNRDPGDPAPGQTFLYEVNYGNQGPVASGSLWLTDTLPLSTTLVSWYSENGYTLWTEEITTSGQFVLSAPALPANWGDRIYLRLRVDDAVPYNTQLVNTVEITTSGDSDPDNNWQVRDDAWVSPPRWNMYLDKNWNWGQLVPGGLIGYGIHYRNNGNVATQARLTDTLPAGTTFVTSTRWTPYGDVPMAPSYVGGGLVAWDVGMLEPGEWSNLSLHVTISPTVAPDTIITNCATVAITQTDEQPYDNTDCVVETVRAAGPNLRVYKESWQDWEGQIEYRIHAEDVGTTRLENVWVTDTYPVATTFNEDWWVEGGPWITMTHDAPNRRILFWAQQLNPGDTASIRFRVDVDDPGARPRWYTNTVEIDTPPGDVYPADNTDTEVTVRGEVERVEMWVGTDHSNLWGNAQPGTAVTVTTSYTQVTAWADPDCGGCWGTDDVGPLYPGDTVTVEAGSGLLPVIIPVPAPFTAEADSEADTVSGQIGGWANRAVEVHGNWPNGYRGVLSDGSGYYTATYGDIPRGGDGYVRYVTRITYAEVIFHRSFRAPDLLLSVNYAHEWVQANYEAGHTVWLTLTDSGGAVKATAALTTGPVPWWGGEIGFQTQWYDWLPSNPDIAPGDWVYGRVDNGYTTTVHLGTISGQVSVDSDTISGTVAAAWWLPQILDVQCHTWGAPWWAPNPQSKQDTVLPNGADAYACAWNPITEWDVEPGQDIAVQYLEPDGDSVYNVFREPAPDLRVEKWVEGGGETSPGHTVVYGVRYYNDGDAPATGVVLTDTLPTSTTYNSDGSGFTAHPSGDVVTWSLGTLSPRSQALFHLALSVDGGVVVSDDIAGNVITITAGNYEPPDWTGNNRAESGGIHVGDGSPDLYVNKNPNLGDPTPGQTFLYEINYGNPGPVASGSVRLTDTLPLSTTLVSWYSENGYTLWTTVTTTGGRLVLSAPALPGYWGDRIILRLRVNSAVSYGTQLTNTVEITTAGDSDPNNNWHMRDDVWVSPPRWDVYLDKSWSWGQLVPGGYAGYGIHYRNNGNMATQAWLTDTLPAGTTFVTSTRWTPYGDVPMAPSYVGGGLVAWDVGRLEPGEWSNLTLHVAISPTIAPDTAITNCATIAITQTDNEPYNNADCVVDTVRAAGPNLRVYKESWWEWEGQINYSIRFENIGNTWLENVWLTDTYPISTTFNDDWWVEWGPWITSTHDALNRQLIFWVSNLNPGDTAGVRLRVDVDEDIRGVQGLIFTNTVEAPWPEDVHPADNSDVELSYTGPDVYVEKWLSGGKPRPGRIVTFTVEFGNRNSWWSGDPGYGSRITDTLPPEMTFLTAVAPWNPDWQPNELPGNAFEWDWGTMWSGSTWYFDVVAQITDTVSPGTVMTNVIQAYGDSPYDVEPFWDNNVFELAITVAPTNTPPTLAGLPDQVFDHVTSPPGTIDLWAHAYDEDTPTSALTYTIAGTPPAGAGVTLSGNRTVTVNPSKTWCGGTDVTVRATDPGGLWDTDTFRVAVSWSCPGPVAMPGAPVLVAPVDGSAASSSAPAFAWHPVVGAEAYRVQVDDDADFASPERDETMSGTDYVPAAGLSGGTYYWRVRAVNSTENGDWSAGWTFRVLTMSPAQHKLYLPVVVRNRL